MTSSGQNVEGWNAVNGVLSTNGVTSNIVVPVGLSSSPVATTQFTTSVNLDANATVGSPDATFSTPIQVYDAQGNAQTLTVTYTETAPNTWTYAVTIPSRPLRWNRNDDHARFRRHTYVRWQREPADTSVRPDGQYRHTSYAGRRS